MTIDGFEQNGMVKRQISEELSYSLRVVQELTSQVRISDLTVAQHWRELGDLRQQTKHLRGYNL